MRKGFLSIEYAFLIAIIVAALVAMSGRFTRTLCSKWRQSADTIGYGRQVE